MNPMAVSDTIVQEITINGPAERIFEALTDPGQLVKWWRAEGLFQATDMESDLRPGGIWMMRGTGREGRPFTVRGEYQQIEPPRLLVFTWIRGGQEDPSETIVRFDLTETDGVTTVRLTHAGLVNEALRSRNNGWPLVLSLLRAFIEQQVRPQQPEQTM
ncbi:MAG: ATPase [Acidobacteria bacterium]|nr:MAG: ATPase [Acidobacteriota bacterium]